MTKIKTVRGYAAQVRYFHSNMAHDANGDWVQLGWITIPGFDYPFSNRKVRQLTNLAPVIIMKGRDLMTINVYQLDATDTIRSQEFPE